MVIGVIAILVALLLPALTKARHQADAIRCASQMRQVLTILHAYGQQYGDFPGTQQPTLYGDYQVVGAGVMNNWGRFGGAGAANDYVGPWPGVLTGAESPGNRRGWIRILNDAGFIKGTEGTDTANGTLRSGMTIFEATPLPGDRWSDGWLSNTGVDTNFGGTVRASYSYYGPGHNSLTA